MSAVLAWLGRASLPVVTAVTGELARLPTWLVLVLALLAVAVDLLERCWRWRIEHVAIHAKNKKTRKAARKVLKLRRPPPAGGPVDPPHDRA